MTPRFLQVSGSALLMTVGDRIDEALTRRIARMMDHLDREPHPGILDIIPSYTTILTIYDEIIITGHEVQRLLGTAWRHAGNEISLENRTVVIPVVYGDEFGEDLREVANAHSWRPDEVIARHVEGRYTVGALGFAPGFAYLLGLDPDLATPRRSRPRLQVPRGSIGIGGNQTGMYALPSPGGWNLIGRTPFSLFRPGEVEPFPVRMGDSVRFERIAASEFRSFDAKSREPDVPSGGVIDVLAPGMQTTVQDLGRYGAGRFGFAPNGAADRASLVTANRAVGNPDNAAGLEITLAGPVLRFRQRGAVAVHGADLGATINGLPLIRGRAYGVMPGDELSFRGPTGVGARAYLAIAGGIDVPEVMGSRSTDLTAGVGGYRGRALQPGDALPVGWLRRPGHAIAEAPTVMDASVPFRVVPGPQRDRFSDEMWDALITRAFAVSADSNRVGLRLEGALLRPEGGADIISEGIVTGSIQVTGEGQPIVMLPGHATIGGYTKIATVVDADLDRLGQLKPGDAIRFQQET